jgi:cytochrome c biogenesis factor
MVWPYVQRSLSHDLYISLSPPEIFAWTQPVSFKAGERKTVQGVTVEYVKPTRTGTPGQPGAKFGGIVRVVDEGKEYEANPTMELTEDGVQPNLTQAGPNYSIALQGMNAADRSINIQLLFSPAIYPITVYYKPLTLLVWLGAGILSFGGLMAAVARRVPRPAPDRTVAEEPAMPEPVESTISP